MVLVGGEQYVCGVLGEGIGSGVGLRAGLAIFGMVRH